MPLNGTSLFHTACAAVLALSLASCGKAAVSAQGADVCAMLAHPDALFGAGAESTVGAAVDAFAGSCQWHSADGRRGGDLVLYTTRSLGAVTPAAQVAHLAENWDAMTETPLAPIAGLGDEAQIATNLPGYQTQIVFREGDKAVAVLAWSGDPALSGEALARQMAQAAATSLAARP